MMKQTIADVVFTVGKEMHMFLLYACKTEMSESTKRHKPGMYLKTIDFSLQK